MAAALRPEPGLEVELVDGDRGELSALVDGRPVIQTKGEQMPTFEDVLAAVRKAARPTSGTAA